MPRNGKSHLELWCPVSDGKKCTSKWQHSLGVRGRTLETAIAVTDALVDTMLLCVCLCKGEAKALQILTSPGLSPSREVCCASRGKSHKSPAELMTRELETLSAPQSV